MTGGATMCALRSPAAPEASSRPPSSGRIPPCSPHSPPPTPLSYASHMRPPPRQARAARCSYCVNPPSAISFYCCRTQLEHIVYVLVLFMANSGVGAMLTRKQHELLLFIHERLKETGIPPSFDEMKDALDLASKSGIHRLITALEERGFIRRLPNRARALEVLRLPESIAPGLGGPRRFSPSVIEGGQGRQAVAQARPAAGNDDVPATVSIPVMGRIAAGVPIEAIQHQT